MLITPESIAARADGSSAAAQFDQKFLVEPQTHVQGQLARFEHLKEIEFTDELPMTTTDRVRWCLLRIQEEERAVRASHARGNEWCLLRIQEEERAAAPRV